MVQQMGIMVGFVSKPKVIRDGQAAMCILRPPSAKELSQKNKAAAELSADSRSKTSLNKPESKTDTTEETTQQ